MTTTREEPPAVTDQGVSDTHDVTVLHAVEEGQDAFVQQCIRIINGKRYGGVLCRCSGRTVKQANNYAKHLMGLHNNTAARLRGEG